MTLRDIPAAGILRAVGDAAERWTDADYPPRVRVTENLVERTGYSMPVVEYALDQLFFPLTADALARVIRNELGGIAPLDGFAARDGAPHAWASPAGNVCFVSSRTTIGVALWPAVFALCAKNDVLVKDREDGLLRAFFETLIEEREEFRTAARAEVWNGADESRDFGAFDAVVAFGRDDTLREIRKHCSPQARFIGYGARASAGFVAREDLADETNANSVAVGAARDLVLYDTEGCLSLHVVFVERGGAVSEERFATILAGAVERAAVEFPVGRRDPAALARIGSVRDLAAFRAAGGSGRVYADGACGHAIVFQPPVAEPPFFLPRVLGVVPVDGPADARSYLQRHSLALEGFARRALREDVDRMALSCGAVRLTTFGELQHPHLGGNHGGRPRMADFVRWIDRE